MIRVTKPSTKMVTPTLAAPSFVCAAVPAPGAAVKNHSPSLLARFGEDKRGSTAIMFALLIAPVMMLTGMAVDFSRMVTVKARMQTAIDAAALAGARAVQVNASASTLTTLAQNAASSYYNAVPMPFVTSKTLSTVTSDSTVTNLSWTATSWVPTPFLSVAGLVKSKVADPSAPAGCNTSAWVCQKVVATASTTIQAGGNNYGYSIETSFMLDITGSMAGQKLTDLQSAAHDAIDILIWQDQSKYTSKVAITPFAQDVRLPTATAFQLATGTAPANATLSGSGSTYNNYGFQKYANQLCVVERTGTNAYTDAAPGAGTGFVMQEWPWKGWGSSCDVPTAAVATPLTTDKTILHNLVNALEASGGTAGHIGTAWAWYMLSPNWNSLWPTANQAAAYDTAYNVNTKVGDPTKIKLKKIAILMTDGDYNQEYTSAGKMTYFGGNPANADSSVQASALCTAMKAKAIEVYTVAFDSGGGLSSTAQNLLSNCATDTNHFYHATSGDALKQAFRDIALKISTIRITG